MFGKKLKVPPYPNPNHSQRLREFTQDVRLVYGPSPKRIGTLGLRAVGTVRSYFGRERVPMAGNVPGAVSSGNFPMARGNVNVL